MWCGKKVNDKSDFVVARSLVVYKIIVSRPARSVNHAFNCFLSACPKIGDAALSRLVEKPSMDNMVDPPPVSGF